MNLKKIFVSSALLVVLLAPSAQCAAKSELVTQPAYNSMSFYVYRPANAPEGFFATYDGYLVYRDAKGVWKYASNENNGIVKTEYVVGSVIPSVVRLKPFDAKVSSVAPVVEPRPMTIRPVGRKFAPGEVISVELDQPDAIEIDVSPITRRPAPRPAPSSTLPANSPLVPLTADWTQNNNFMAIGRWQKSVDRIGVLDKPQTPVAWKGDYPEVIYAWTGMQWRQMTSRGRHVAALSTIRREIYAFTVHTNKLNALHWDDDDTYVLSQYAMMWGYRWLGQLLLGREY